MRQNTPVSSYVGLSPTYKYLLTPLEICFLSAPFCETLTLVSQPFSAVTPPCPSCLFVPNTAARFFPFNLSNYLKFEFAKDEFLIKSIKLQTEKENAKERKKEKKGKKEKKHKSGKSKEESSHKKRKHSDRSQLGDQDDYIQEEEHGHKKRKHSDRSELGDQDDSIQEECSHKKRKHSDRSQLGDQDDYIQEERSHKKRKHSDQDDCSRKPMKDVIQQVDKSSLTEENSPPCFNLNPNDSSDSTQDSNKRKLAVPDALALPVRSARIFRVKPVQKPTDGERPAASAQLQPRFSGGDVDGEQLHVKNRGLLGLGSRDSWPPASNKLDVLDRNNVLLPPFGLQKPTDGERPATSVELQPRFSGRVVCGEQLLAKNRTPLIQKSSDPVAPSSNKLGSGVLDRNNHLLQKPADRKKSATRMQYQPGLAGRAVDGGQLQAKNRTPVMQKSSDLVLPSSNKPAGVLRRNNVLPPKPTDGKKAATSVLPQRKLTGRAVDGGQLQVKNTTPVIQKSSDLVPPSSHKLAGVLDRSNVLPEYSELERPTDGKNPATNVPHQLRLSGRAVDEGKNRTPVIQKSRDPVPLSSNKLGIQKSRDPVPPSDKLAGVLDKDNFLPTPSGLQKPTDGKRSATSVEAQTRFSGREVDRGQPVNYRTLIQNNRDPAPQVACVLDRVLPKSTNGEKPATSGQTESSFSGRAVDGPVKTVLPESRDLGPPSSNKLDGVSDMNVDLPLPKVLQLEPPVAGIGIGVTSQGHARKSEHKSSRSRSGSKDEARRLFEKLIVNWIPPALQFDLADDDDQDWLFASKPSNVQRCVPSLPPSQQSDMLAYQPHATYLPQVEVYALPYVVPF